MHRNLKFNTPYQRRRFWNLCCCTHCIECDESTTEHTLPQLSGALSGIVEPLHEDFFCHNNTLSACSVVIFPRAILRSQSMSVSSGFYKYVPLLKLTWVCAIKWWQPKTAEVCTKCRPPSILVSPVLRPVAKLYRKVVNLIWSLPKYAPHNGPISTGKCSLSITDSMRMWD